MKISKIHTVYANIQKFFELSKFNINYFPFNFISGIFALKRFKNI